MRRNFKKKTKKKQLWRISITGSDFLLLSVSSCLNRNYFTIYPKIMKEYNILLMANMLKF